MPDKEPLVVTMMREFRADLMARDEAQMAVMAHRWSQLQQQLEPIIFSLASEIEQAQYTGQTVTLSRLYRLDWYRRLLPQMQYEIDNYLKWLGPNIADMQTSYIAFALDSTQSVLAQMFKSGGVTASFDLLPVEAVQNMVGLAGDGSPLSKLLKEAYKTSANAVTESLIRSTALGINPRQTAREMSKAMGQGLTRLLSIARTEQLRVYRDAARRSYQESGVVSAYKRIATRDMRVCAACLLDDGRVYPLSADFPEHVNGRCATIPVVKGLPVITWKYGPQWLIEQEPDVQRGILGAGRYEAWQAGQINLSDIVKIIPNDTWGPSIQPRPLKELMIG